jgi:hypothetical protein
MKPGSTIVVVTGGRDYAVADVVFRALDDINGTTEPMLGDHIHSVYHGACGVRGRRGWRHEKWRDELRGADGLAERWAQSRGVRSFPFPAFWDDFRVNRSAGPIRNGWMLGAAKNAAAALDVDLVVLAFKGDNGTFDCCEQAKRLGIGLIDLRENS